MEVYGLWECEAVLVPGSNGLLEKQAEKQLVSPDKDQLCKPSRQLAKLSAVKR